MPQLNLLPSTPRVATTPAKLVKVASVDQIAGGLFILDITATPNNAEKLTLSLEAFDPASQKWTPVVKFPASKLASELGAAPTTATLPFVVYPAALEKNNVGEVAAVPLPQLFRAVVTHSGAGSWTYTLSYQSLS